MNPYDEEILRAEVLYLHSLWHRGPPSNRRPKPHLPNNPTPLKKQKPDPPPDSGPEWPVHPLPSPPSTFTPWPEPKPTPPKEPISDQDHAKLLALQVQTKAVDICRRFFSQRVCEEESEDEEGGDDYTECEEYRFLLDVFVNDEKLREYYEKNNGSGWFCCLVCGGIGEKVNKRYKDCLGLVQHANEISKTKGKRLHKVLVKVLCDVLGWDLDRLPVVVLKGQPLGRVLANSSSTQGVAHNDKLDGSSETINSSELVEIEALTASHIDHGDMEVWENSSKVDDCTKDVEIAADADVLNVETDKDAAVECKNPLKVDDSSKCVEIVDAKVSNAEATKAPAIECQECCPSLVASKSWSCVETVDELSPIRTGWATSKPTKPLEIQLASVEDQAKLAAVKLQNEVLEACRIYFEKNASSDDDDDDEEYSIMDEDEDDLIDKNESENSEEFKFFMKIFLENNELRNYYQKSFEAGEFCCLVCGGIGKKVSKRFKDCLGLLQHSTAILKTKKKHAHRAFAQVVCKVLGWDVDKLPMIVAKGDPLDVLQVVVAKNAESIQDESATLNNNADCEYDDNRDTLRHSSIEPLLGSEVPSRIDDSTKDLIRT